MINSCYILYCICYISLQVDCVILCYNLSDTESIKNIENLWLPEIRSHNSSAPLILVGRFQLTSFLETLKT